MSNINRDYLCILDVKTGAINAPKMYFYNTDRSTSNIYVQLVVKETIVNATPIENATDFVIEAKIIKPNGFVKEMTGQLVNEADAIYEFDLPEDFTDLTGINQVEFWVRAKVSDREERITSASTKYTVKGSILNSIDDDIEDDNDYPIFLALMERVERLDIEVTEVSLATKALNEEAKGELAKIKADEVEIANNEARRQEQEAARERSEDTRGANESRRIQAEAAREQAEATRESAETSRIAYENRRESQERERVSNEYDRQNAEQSREYAEIDRVANEEIRQTNEANREASEEIRKANEQARIAEHETFRTEQQAMKTELDEVKAENAILMENDKKVADRMTQVEISDKRQYVIMEGLMNSAGDGYLKIEDTGNDTTLYNSVEGFVDVKNITGNTMVNSIKNPDDELTLNGDINTSGQSVTLTTAVDNGQVDVLAEGNTMVNVCDQQEAVAITKSYTVESGNHVVLQGEYDGKARPVVHGNTLWIDNDTEELLTEFDDTKNLRLQSSFEDKVVTQEMVDSGEELAENLGKYRVDYKVTGKNKININDYHVANKYSECVSINGNTMTFNQGDLNYYDCQIYMYLQKGTQYIMKCDEGIPLVNYQILIGRLDAWKGNDYLLGRGDNNGLFPVIPKTGWYTLHLVNLNRTITNLQLEEGSTATTYEPYKEFTKTYYLNSPLLEGDTIEESGGNVYHVHRYKKVVFNGSESWNMHGSIASWFYLNISDGIKQISEIYVMSDRYSSIPYNSVSNIVNKNITLGTPDSKICRLIIKDEDYTTVDAFKTYLQSNPLTVIYKLASPTYELISQSDTILMDSYVAGHLDFDTAVPVERVEFRDWGINVKYAYPSTDYMLQFESDNVGKLDYLYFTSKVCLENLDIIKGINKFRFTTNSSVTSNWMSIKGIGFNASNIVVTEATDKDFGYFSGMKSVGELEENKIEILSSNKNLFDINELYLQEAQDSMGTYKPLVTDNGNGTYSIHTDTVSTSWFKKGIHLKPMHVKAGQTMYMKGSIKYSHNVAIFRYGDFSSPLYFKNNIYNADGEFVDVEFNYTFEKDEFISFRIWQGNDDVPVEIKDLYISLTDNNYIPHAENKKQILLNEPLRAVGDTKDRFVQIDGKWYVERNVGEIVFDGSEKWTRTSDTVNCYETKNGCPDDFKDQGNLICDNILYERNRPWVGDEGIRFAVASQKGLYRCSDKLPNKIVYELASPTYEPVEITPTVNTYTDVTHITNNSTIPMNMPIVNSGYEVIAKPSTKYTVVGIDSGRIGDSTIVNGTITTPATITDNFLRPYGTGKTRKVMLLEGEPANIPGYFKGIKSVFEDKVTEDGKYAVEVKVVGKNLFDGKNKCGYYGGENGLYYVQQSGNFASINPIKIYPNTNYSSWHDGTTTNNIRMSFYDNNMNFITQKLNVTNTSPSNACYMHIHLAGISKAVIVEGNEIPSEYEPYHETKQTLYLDEPLYNTNNITIYNDKLGYWKNWDSAVLDGSENYIIVNTTSKFIEFNTDKITYDTPCECNSFINYVVGDFERICISPYGIYVKIHKSKLSTQDASGFKQYLSQNPITVVYQLAEPVFVPLIDNCPNFVIGSWDNCSIHFDSIIPLKDTRYRYTGNVPSVMAMSNDVAAVSDISDQQDSMIIDLATQVATMEMMLM